MARIIQDLSDFVFSTLPTSPLPDVIIILTTSGLGLKMTLAAFRTAPVHLGSLYLDSVIKKAKKEITNYDDKYYSGSSHKKPGQYHSYSKS